MSEPPSPTHAASTPGKYRGRTAELLNSAKATQDSLRGHLAGKVLIPTPEVFIENGRIYLLRMQIENQFRYGVSGCWFTSKRLVTFLRKCLFDTNQVQIINESEIS